MFGSAIAVSFNLRTAFPSQEDLILAALTGKRC